MSSWYHDKKAGLVKEEGKPGYICRGFLPEHGPMLAAAPDMYEALLTLTNLLEIHRPEWYSQAHSELAKAALVKARGGK